MLEYLDWLKNFLADRTVFAFMAFSVLVNVYLFRLYIQEKDAHFQTVVQWLPLAEKMQFVLTAAAEKARAKRERT